MKNYSGIPSTRSPFTNCRGSEPLIEASLRLKSSIMSPLIWTTSGFRCQGELESLSSIDQKHMIFAFLRVADNVTLADDYEPPLHFISPLRIVNVYRRGVAGFGFPYISTNINHCFSWIPSLHDVKNVSARPMSIVEFVYWRSSKGYYVRQ